MPQNLYKLLYYPSKRNLELIPIPDNQRTDTLPVLRKSGKDLANFCYRNVAGITMDAFFAEYFRLRKEENYG